MWNYTGDVRSTRASGIETGDEETFRVPQVDAHVGLEQPIWKRKKKKKKKRETRKFWEIGSGERDVDEHEMAKVALSPATSSRSNSSTQSSASSQSKQAIRETVEIPIDASSESAVEEPRKTDMEPIFPSPMYEELETNIPRTLMCFSDLAFPSDCQLFPRHQAVKEYIDEYAKELLPLIKFETQVQDVRLLEAGRNASSDTGSETSEIIREKWLMKTKELRTGRIRERTYDAVVMANGHYSVPHVPEIEGAREWNEMFPGSMMHSRSFRTAEEFRDKVMTCKSSKNFHLISADVHFVHLILESHRHRQLRIRPRHRPPDIQSLQTTTFDFPTLPLGDGLNSFPIHPDRYSSAHTPLHPRGKQQQQQQPPLRPLREWQTRIPHRRHPLLHWLSLQLPDALLPQAGTAHHGWRPRRTRLRTPHLRSAPVSDVHSPAPESDSVPGVGGASRGRSTFIRGSSGGAVPAGDGGVGTGYAQAERRCWTEVSCVVVSRGWGVY